MTKVPASLEGVKPWPCLHMAHVGGGVLDINMLLTEVYSVMVSFLSVTSHIKCIVAC